MTLKEIWIYPVKSLGGISLSSSRVLEKGLVNDRRFMLVDNENNFMTQRDNPEMALLKVSLKEDSFLISFQGETLILPIQPPESNDVDEAVIWNDTVEVILVGTQFDQWFSEMLGKKCRLVYFPETNSRPVDYNYAKNNEQVSLADGYPFLIIGANSLQDLNDRLDIPLPMNRFRPNFVFSGGMPFEEDSWRNFSIGNNRFVGLKPCARCTITTIDQNTAEKGVEPLVTMAGFRKRNGKVFFGQNLIAVDYREVKVGDEIKVESYQ